MRCPGLLGNNGGQKRGKPTAFSTSFQEVPAAAVTVIRSRSNFAPDSLPNCTCTPSVTVCPLVECPVLRTLTALPDVLYFLRTVASSLRSAGCSTTAGTLRKRFP